MNETTTLELIDPRLETAIAQSGLEPQSAQGLLERFKPLFRQANELCAAAQNIAVTDATQVSEIKRARQTRLAIRAVRIEAEKTRKVLKEDSLRRSKAIDGVYNVLEYAVVPVETKLLEMEEFAERAEAARKAKLKQVREELAAPYIADVALYNLGELSEDAFKQLFDGAKLAHETRLAAQKKAEEERIAKELAEAQERERIRQENERLKKEAIAREEEARKERERLEAIAKAERAKAEQARIEAEAKARKEREEAEAAAKIEREARAKAEAEAKRLRDAEEARKRAEAAAKRKAAAAPDREKIKATAAVVRSVAVPEMATLDGQRLASELARIIKQAADRIDALAVEMEGAA